MNKDKILEQAARAAEQLNQQPQQQVQIQPQPVPTGFSIGQGQNPDGSMSVVLVIFSPVGQNVFFMDADTAKSLAKGMLDAASASGAGLVVAK